MNFYTPIIMNFMNPLFFILFQAFSITSSQNQYLIKVHGSSESMQLLAEEQSTETLKMFSNCITFSVSQGTGCDWMCNYCANKLGTNNYYFTDNVCKYVDGTGCVGSPYAGVSYTCCSTTVETND